MRGVAAFTVMVYHYYMRGNSPYLLNPYIAVDFFFILSGFVIMHSYGERLRSGMSVSSYLIRRVIRLYPMMACGILVGIPGLALYSAQGHTSFSLRDILASAIANLAFIPFFNTKDFIFPDGVTRGELFPSDGPLWSIFFELFASVAFVYLVKLTKSALLRFSAICFLFVVLSGIYFAFLNYEMSLQTGTGWGTLNLLGGFPRVLYGFSCGMLLYELRGKAFTRKSSERLPQDTTTLFLFGALLFCMLFPHRLHGLFYLIVVGVVAPAIVWFASDMNTPSPVLRKLSQFLGWISFPLYCLHKPILIAVCALDEMFDFQTMTGLSREVLAMIATTVLAVLLTKCFDEPVRRWLTTKFHVRLNPGAVTSTTH